MERSYFYGIYGIRFIWHGEQADPELVWHGHTFRYYDVETPLYEMFREECDNDEIFAEWVKKHAYLAREIMTCLMEGETA
jgi:hypothetical protein